MLEVSRVPLLPNPATVDVASSTSGPERSRLASTEGTTLLAELTVCRCLLLDLSSGSQGKPFPELGVKEQESRNPQLNLDELSSLRCSDWVTAKGL